MKIKKHRKAIQYSTARLRRARRLYCRLCLNALLDSSDNRVMDWMNNRMEASGMYAKPWSQKTQTQIQRDRRYRIARWAYYLDRQDFRPGDDREWNAWLRRNGFDWGFNKRASRSRQNQQAG